MRRGRMCLRTGECMGGRIDGVGMYDEMGWEGLW